jgi:hypothetical protein
MLFRALIVSAAVVLFTGFACNAYEQRELHESPGEIGGSRIDPIEPMEPQLSPDTPELVPEVTNPDLSLPQPDLPNSGGSPGGGAPPNTLHYNFAVSYCVYSDNMAAGECDTDASFQQTAERIARMYYDKFLSDVMGKGTKAWIEFSFPTAWSEHERWDTIKALATESLKLVSIKLHHDVNTLTPYNWRVEDNRAVDNWIARNSGSYGGGGDFSISDHSFSLGPTYYDGVSIYHFWQS